MKPIKFNLSYGNEQIKTLAELKENCNIDMLLETHSNGLLVRWLTAHGETEKAQKVSKIKTDDKQKALEQLFETLFGSFPTIMGHKTKPTKLKSVMSLSFRKL